MNPHPTHRQPNSWLVTAGRSSEPGASLNVPLVPASNCIIGGLESGRAVAIASGMAAIAAVLDQLHAGATVALPDDCYQGVAGLVDAGAERGRWSVQRLALHDTPGARTMTLAAHPAVEEVRYPGLESHLTHATARRVLKGFGTIISFDVHGDAAEAAART